MSAPRRWTKLSLPPLWLIGLCLFLPTVRACEKLESPAQLLWGSKPLFVALLAPYLVAAPLVVVGVIALGRARVTPPLGRAAIALAVGAAASAAVLAALGLDGRDFVAQLWRAFAALALVAGAVVLVRARRLEPWARFGRTYAAYTIFTLPMAALLARIVVADGPQRCGVGAFVFLAAFAALVVVHARQLVSSSTA